MSTVPTIIVNASTDMDVNYMYCYPFYFLDATAGNISIDLTDQNIGNGLYYEFYRTDASINTCTITAKTGYTINGGASITLAANQYLKIINNGTDWVGMRFTCT